MLHNISLWKNFRLIHSKIVKIVLLKTIKVVFLNMQHITGIPRNQLRFISLEDTILKDNPVRFIDAFQENTKHKNQPRLKSRNFGINEVDFVEIIEKLDFWWCCATVTLVGWRFILISNFSHLNHQIQLFQNSGHNIFCLHFEVDMVEKDSLNLKFQFYLIQKLSLLSMSFHWMS